jgi:putative membrane protein
MAAFGIGLAIWLLLANDLDTVLRAFAAVGWGLAAMILVRLCILFMCGGAWSLLLRRQNPPGMLAFQSIRFIREAINVMLPVATVGGDIIGGRLIRFFGVSASLSAASILVDLLLQASGQAVFALLGALLLAQVAGAEGLVQFVLAGLGVAAIGLIGFFLVQRLGGIRLVERAIAFVLNRLARSGGQAMEGLNIHGALNAIWADPKAVGAAFVLHVLAWLIGVLEIWIALACMGSNATLADAAIIESLGQALRGAAFPVPGAIGVQEGGFVILGAALGIGPDIAIALSFAKRVPDIALGLPGLLAWHWLEKRMRRNGAMMETSS